MEEDELQRARSLIARHTAGLRKRTTIACEVCRTTKEVVVRSGATAPRYCSPKCNLIAWRAARKGKPPQ